MKKASDWVLHIQNIISEHGDFPMGVTEPGCSYSPVKSMEVRSAVTMGHWEDRDDPDLGTKFIAID